MAKQQDPKAWFKNPTTRRIISKAPRKRLLVREGGHDPASPVISELTVFNTGKVYRGYFGSQAKHEPANLADKAKFRGFRILPHWFRKNSSWPHVVVEAADGVFRPLAELVAEAWLSDWEPGKVLLYANGNPRDCSAHNLIVADPF